MILWASSIISKSQDHSFLDAPIITLTSVLNPRPLSSSSLDHCSLKLSKGTTTSTDIVGYFDRNLVIAFKATLVLPNPVHPTIVPCPLALIQALSA